MNLLNKEDITISNNVCERTMQIFWTTVFIRPPLILKKGRYTQKYSHSSLKCNTVYCLIFSYPSITVRDGATLKLSMKSRGSQERFAFLQ